MVGKLFKFVFKVSYGFVLAGLLFVAWDFTQQWQSAEGDYELAQYMDSFSDRYGDEIARYSQHVQGLAKAGMTWVVENDLPAKVGLDAFFEANIDVQDVSPIEATQETAPVILASTNDVAAPEISLLPQARTSE